MKRTLTAVLLLLLALALTSCQGGAQTLDLFSLQDEDGHFRPGHIQWGASADDIEQAIGKGSLGRYRGGIGENVYYEAANTVRWEGRSGMLSHFIRRDGLPRRSGLVSIHYLFTGTEAELDELYDSIRAELAELYGEPDNAALEALGVDMDEIEDDAKLAFWPAKETDGNQAAMSLEKTQWWWENDQPIVLLVLEAHSW
jgi:hypothetical protein